MDKERKNLIEIGISIIAFFISLYMFLTSWAGVSSHMLDDVEVSGKKILVMILWLLILLIAAGLSMYTLSERRILEKEKTKRKTYKR